jgi:hypothetical protein
MKENEVTFLQYLDIMSNGCRVKNSFIRNWRKKNLDWAIEYSHGYTDIERDALKDKARSLLLI